MSEHIPIFCATDENYAPFASLMIRSLLSYTKSFVDFYIMDGGVKKKTKKMIKKDLENYPNKNIYYVDMSAYDLKQFPCSEKFARFSENAFSRYFIPEIVPNLKKAIYMDVDIIVKQDILELFNQDLNGHPIGATPCDFNGLSMTNQIRSICPDVDANSISFNSGLLLMDIPKLIEMDFTNRAICLTNTFRDKLIFPDQDILNIMFEKDYLALDYRFDFMHSSLPRLKVAKNIKTIDPLMIHYTSKPWRQNVSYQEDFDEVLHKSLFYKMIFKKWHSRKIRYYLFGLIPIFKKYISKDVFLNQSFVEKNYPISILGEEL